jgi:hypothetical protein
MASPTPTTGSRKEGTITSTSQRVLDDPADVKAALGFRMASTAAQMTTPTAATNMAKTNSTVTVLRIGKV